MVQLTLAARPGAVAQVGEVLGAARISLDGSGVFSHCAGAIAHFLVDDGERDALESPHPGPVTLSEAVTLSLHQETPGQHQQ